MFNQKVLEKMFDGKEFGYGKYYLYFYSEEKGEDYCIEEQDCDVEILDGVVKITTYTTKGEEDNYARDEKEGEDYIPFERIVRISFVEDF